MDTEVKVTTPADPVKLAAYKASKRSVIPPKPKVDIMGRRKPERTGMTAETAKYITDQRILSKLRYITRED